MRLTKLVPNLFYQDIQIGLNLFVDCLGFKIGFDDHTSGHRFCVLQKDDVKLCMIEDAEFADKDHRPEMRMETDDIQTLYEQIKKTHPELLHPNGNTVTRKPWGCLEFALRDASDVCLIFQQW